VRDAQQLAAWRALAAGLKSGDDSGKHVMTFHPPGMRPDPKDSGTSGRWFHDDELLNFNMLQTGLRYHPKAEVRFFPPGDESESDWVLILRQA